MLQFLFPSSPVSTRRFNDWHIYDARPGPKLQLMVIRGLPAIIAVDLYSGLKGQRLRPSSVTTSPLSLLTREKLSVFWGTHTSNIHLLRWETVLTYAQPLFGVYIWDTGRVCVLWIGLRGLEGFVEKKWLDSFIIWLPVLYIFIHFPLVGWIIK